jgi:hypothetical protein
MAGILGQGQEQQGIMGLLNSPQMRGITQALLAASGPQANGQRVGIGQALGKGMQLGTQFEQQDYNRKLEELMLGLEMKQLEAKDQITPYQREYLDIQRGNLEQKKSKPMPATAVKLQNEMLEDLKTANNIDADLGTVIKQLETGQLKLGPLQNKISEGMNWAGKSDELSRNYGTFKTNLEKLRNDSLRLNKGVQTEGDAVRAWDEILSNMNDTAFVTKRLKEVQTLNQRAADFKKLSIEEIRSNFGADPMDFTQFNSTPAINNQSPAASTGNVISYEDYFK